MIGAGSRARLKRMLLLAALGAALLLAGPLTGKSSAGTYVGEDCSSSNGGYTAAQYVYSHPMNVVIGACEPGGWGLGMALPAAVSTANQTGSAWSIAAPAGTYFSYVWMLQRGASDPGDGWEIGVHVGGPGGGNSAGAHPASNWTAISTPPGVYTTLASQLTCVAAGGCSRSDQAGIYVRDLLFTMVDDTPPTASSGGELLSNEVQHGAGGLEVSGHDIGAGLAKTFVVVNGETVESQTYGCPGVPAFKMAPCAPDQQTHFVLDTQSQPFHDGANQIQACAADYATTSSPNIGCAATRTVQVDNSCPASKVPGGSGLTARFPRSDKDTVTVRSRKSALMTGRLTDRSGEPLEGATLCMSEATAGDPLAGVGTVKTNDAGRYRYTVSPGPSRDVDVAYRFNRHELHSTAHYRARVIPSLRLSRGKVENGRRIRLFGRLPGPRNQNRIVVLQARYPGKNQRWKTFQKARTDQHGQYTAPYRFSSTVVTTDYEMRAVAPRQNGYPFLTGHSRTRLIRVIGR